MARICWPNGSTTNRPNLSAEGHFGPRNSTAPGASKYHRGQDMWGLGIIRAIADGTVVAVGWGAGHGWGGGYQVWIQHDGFFTRSLHMVNGSSPVKVGDRVSAGDAIGTEGMTGAYQVHLHLEITPGQWHARNDGQVDPVAFITARLNPGTTAGSPEEEEDMPLNDADLKKIDELVERRVRDAVKELAGSTAWNHKIGENGNHGRNDRAAWERLGRAETAAIEAKQAAQWVKERLGGTVDDLDVDTKLDNLTKG